MEWLEADNTIDDELDLPRRNNVGFRNEFIQIPRSNGLCVAVYPLKNYFCDCGSDYYHAI